MRNIILIVEQEIVLFAILFNGNDDTWIQSNNFVLEMVKQVS
jgi:hypothetical protein